MDQVLVLVCKQLELGKNKLPGVQEEEKKETNRKIIFFIFKNLSLILIHQNNLKIYKK
jgi:hypothetical protein